ncbi:MAG: type II secretion system F family protein [Chloroflexota bacterium]
MMVPPLVFGVLAACSVILVFAGILLRSEPDPVKSRLNQFAVQPTSLLEIELQQPFTTRIIKPIVTSIAGVIMRQTPKATVEQLRHQLLLAGNPSGLEVSDFLGIKGIAAFLLGGLFFFIVARTSSVLGAVIIGAVLAVLGFYLPNLWLNRKITQRKAEITRALPDVLDLLTISVEAGLGFDAAIHKVTEKWDNALTREFRRVLSEMRMGKARRDALRDLVTRTDVADVNTFIAAIIQADQLGVSISNVLHVQAEQMRTRRRQRAEEAAHKAPIKMIFPMVFLIFPAMYVIILGPAIPTMLNSFGIK